MVLSIVRGAQERNDCKLYALTFSLITKATNPTFHELGSHYLPILQEPTASCMMLAFV